MAVRKRSSLVVLFFRNEDRDMRKFASLFTKVHVVFVHVPQFDLDQNRATFDDVQSNNLEIYYRWNYLCNSVSIYFADELIHIQIDWSCSEPPANADEGRIAW